MFRTVPCALLLLAASLAPLQAGGKKQDPAFAPVKDDPSLPRVLLIGDSSSIGYTPAVRELLKGKANVHRIPANGGPTINGLKNIDAWLGKGDWDVIHFNWGLHDLKYMGPNKENLADPKAATSHQQVSLADYEKNLETLVGKLKATGAKLISDSATSSPRAAVACSAWLQAARRPNVPGAPTFALVPSCRGR